MNRTYFDQSGRFVIRDYAERCPFASFLPGIAGIMGIPMWVFYVNRGQAMAAFGVESKDVPIMEFQPANKAYQAVPYTGFRTFIKMDGPQGFRIYEPFSPLTRHPRHMAIGANELEIQERAPHHGLQVNVLYFNLVDEPFAGLVRRVTITNTESTPVHLSVLDGLPAVIPYGVTNAILKEINRTAEAWMGVYNLEQHIPFYRVRSSIVDKVEVEDYQAGHFYAAFTESGRLPALVDPQIVFGQDTSLTQPNRLLVQSLDDLFRAPQIVVGKTPCGFFGAEQTLPAHGTLTICGIIGHAGHVDLVNNACARITTPAYVDAQYQAARDLVETLTDTVAIKTGEPLLDAYTRQTFLDNVMRGGWPIELGDPSRPVIQHVYSRRHGDLERDYNAFYLAPEFYSQGNGAYRDVNQNRREDVWLNPRVDDFNVVAFMNLIQADGYNPLIIQGNRFVIPPSRQAAVLADVKNQDSLETFLAKPFTPGELLKYVAANHLELRVSPQVFVSHALCHADWSFEATFGEGYWIDHWTYNLDLIDNYLSIYPERKDELLFGKPVFTFYDSAMMVRPRAQTYVLVGDNVRQLQAVAEDQEKAALIATRTDQPHVMRVDQGLGAIYRTTLFAKLVCLALVKFATRDPLGMGIEMEAGRPGWYDALNGLPGLFGSSMPETFELARLLAFLRGAIAEHGEGKVDLPIEVYRFLRSVVVLLEILDQTIDPQSARVYWDAVAAARETYRERIRLGFDGTTRVLTLFELDQILERFAAHVQSGIHRAIGLNPAHTGIPPTYFIYEVAECELRSDMAQTPCAVHVKRFKPAVLPLFLEGPVHALKMQPNRAAAEKLYRQVKASPLFDSRLRMYKVNASLDDQPMDIGRARAFTPGWLENESIWLHMEYKYLLAMLKAGLYAEFYEDFPHVLIPFQNPDVYGRSVLENSSFLVSSIHPDASLHGRGFVARLSGSTVEYLSILHHLMIGERPFVLVDERLRFALKPALAGWLFDDAGIVQCKFLGAVTITYHNPLHRDTFGKDAVTPQQYTLETADGSPVEIVGSIVEAPYAAMIREGKVTAIRVELGFTAP